ncbi:MAG: hypothetical protein A3H51_03090 [Candidatus Spechtbacteria bacterium RIFCSPLOWO2_02_FULL_38_8]|uniref:Small ribosomal subunit protein uS4 n=1 Tax=Candidatus Spechtbacteria bacterium RIFCSPLOWO2_02_FULL_38_8 TaxID=1802164 RepID=A0A1G2HG37_9BACT|nr:MAG: hypothetical protein A3H51_03090 [Candidatus Spechtbacteria bacterium RIFCSPLOWO2_02_FULL_38_8]
MAKSTTTKSEYGLQLAEKQKIKREYGLRERQFKNYFSKGKSPDNIFVLLERRLDSIIFGAGFTPTRRAARQMVSHGHVLVDGRKVTVPSFNIIQKNIINIKEGSNQKGMFADLEFRTKNYDPPSWLSVDKKKLEVKLKGEPSIKEQVQPFNLQTVIEFYSR